MTYECEVLKTCEMFVIALAVSNILMCTSCMPFTVASIFHGSWIFGETVCRFQAVDTFTFGMSSLGTMTAIAVSRYFCVINQEKYWLWLHLCPCYPSKTAALNSSLEKQCVCTNLKVTLLTLSQSFAVSSQLP